MRFVPTYCLREGMILGDNLYNNYGELMLAGGTELTKEYVSSIERLQYNGVYINDDISKDIQIINIINDSVRAKAVKSIKDVFIHCEKGGNIKHDVKKARRQVEHIVDEIFAHRHLMVNMVDMKVFDDYTYYHSVNVAVLSIVLGVALKMERSELCNLGFAALLHDIGKVFVSKEILNKPGKLTPAEFEEIKSHSLLGCNHIKKGYGVSNTAYMGILDHHEQYDGGGYPNSLKGENISWYGRIISVADVYDALTSDRPYRKAMLPSDAMEYIMGSNKTKFDPKVVEVFVKKIAPYPIGTCVRLSNGLTGIVVENYEDLCMRPRIRIFMDQERDVDAYEIELADYESLNITVVKVV
ncbi:MAG TPA: HD-GYP domain-containing protein [Bacillota bacterium]|nr:HD-GYP domain-containing protein [Bacillota bacterium]